MSDRPRPHLSAVRRPPGDTSTQRAADDTAPFASNRALESTPRHRIVIVGGGAGGLELAARLGRLPRLHDGAEVLLVDAQLTHFWKPLLHEVAAGTLPPQANQAEFLQQARRHRFRFHLGRMQSLERAHRRIWLAPLEDDDDREVAPRRAVRYDTLVIAIGSIVNDFGTPGVGDHATALDTDEDARRFHRRLLAACARAEIEDDPVDIVIVGGGATGVELAAELRESVRTIAGYGATLSRMAAPVRLSVVEATPRLLGALPAAVADRARADLEDSGVQLLLGQRVTKVSSREVTLESGGTLSADLCVWAAGIQGPPTLRDLDGLELDRTRRLVVRPDLRTTRDANVFAFGDCASIAAADAQVPATAQAAQQQADHLARVLPRLLDGDAILPPFRYRERGSLVSLGSRRATGELASPAIGRSVVLYGLLARLAYWALQRRHVATLHGYGRAVLMMIGWGLSASARSRVKLH